MDNNAPEAAEEADMQNEILLPPVQHKYTHSNKTLSARAEVSIGHSFIHFVVCLTTGQQLHPK